MDLKTMEIFHPSSASLNSSMRKLKIRKMICLAYVCIGELVKSQLLLNRWFHFIYQFLLQYLLCEIHVENMNTVFLLEAMLDTTICSMTNRYKGWMSYNMLVQGWQLSPPGGSPFCTERKKHIFSFFYFLKIYILY